MEGPLLGPRPLGRGAVVGPGQPDPPGLEGVDRHEISAATLDHPDDAADALHAAWAGRRPVVIELSVDAAALKAPQTSEAAPYTLGPSFAFGRERLHFATWANTYDCRRGQPVWWHGVRACRLGATPAAAPDALRGDVVLPSGELAWCDGGPRGTGLIEGPVVHRDSIDAGRLTVMMPPSPDDAGTAGLAPDQLAAVLHLGGPARIIAPAGSGKTRVLAARVRQLLGARHVEPDLVTAVAYNVKAAEELRARVGGLHPTIRTLNALGLAILRWRGQVRVADEREVRNVIESLVTLPRQVNTDPVAPYLDGLSLIRLGLVEPEEAAALYRDADGLAELFPRYRRELERRGAVDFDDQIYGAIEVLLQDPAARSWARRTTKTLLVDEFQDLTPAHVLLIRLLAGPSGDVFGVGDDDQVIYGYAGADPDFLIRFDHYFPGAATHQLEVNYRCPPAVVDAAGKLLSHNRRRVDKPLRAGRSVGTPAPKEPLVTRPVAATALATVTASHVAGWLADGRSPGDIAVLARVNAALLPAQLALRSSGVPVRPSVGVDVLNRTGTAAALAYLRIGLAPDQIDRSDVLATIRRPSRRIARNVVQMITKRPTTSLADLDRLAEWLTGGDADRVADYADDLRAVEAAASRGTAAALRAIRDEVGLGAAMATLDSFRGAVDRSAHEDDLWALEQVAELHPETAGFEGWLRRELTAPGDPEGVTLSTVHRVKGQEWPCVVVFGATAALFPHRLADDVEEERRIFHVAITRAIDALVIVADEASPSPFLDELTRTAPPHAPAEPSRPVPTSKGRRAGPGATDLEAGAEAAWVALRQWRTEQAKRDGVPPYVVMSDAYLRGIARSRPADLRALGRCPGIGPTKLDRYGDDILSVLAALPA